MPFANGRVTSLFNQGRRHPAIDLAGALGSPVLATTSAANGRVRGRQRRLRQRRDHARCDRPHASLRALQSITSRVGQVLEQGEKLGHLGSTGFSTGPHVHYEVTDSKGRHIDPVTLLFPGRRVAKGYAWLDVRQAQQAGQVAADARGSAPPAIGRHALVGQPHAVGHAPVCQNTSIGMPPRGYQ